MAGISTLTETIMQFAENIAKLSRCEDRQVGAVITNSEMTKIYSMGYNGGAAGLADCLCATEGKYGCIHAEINALIKCTTEDNRKVMFVTLMPCKQCAAAIINAGFSKVYYRNIWKDDTGKKMLHDAGIQCIHWPSLK